MGNWAVSAVACYQRVEVYIYLLKYELWSVLFLHMISVIMNLKWLYLKDR